MSRRYRLQSNGPVDLEASNRPFTENREDRNAFANGTLYRVSRVAGVPVILKAWVTGENEIEVEVTPAEGGDSPPGPIVEAALRRKFSLDLDLPAFYAFLASIPQLSSLAAHHRGLRPILKDTLLEALSLAIADQQVNVAFAAELKQRLLSTHGKCYKVDGQSLWLFPSADELAGLDEFALRPLQFTRNKSRYIIGLAREFTRDSSWARLTGTDEEIVSRLDQLMGVGRWTAEYAAMIGLGLVDTLPAADIALMRMVQQTYELPERPDEQALRKIGEQWSPWRGMVTFYLWRQEELIEEALAPT